MQRMELLGATECRRAAPAHLTRRRAMGWALGAVAALGVPSVARAAHEVRAWPAGRAVPMLSLRDLDGQPWHLSDLKGRAVLLNFWASWCDPCRAEMPSLQRLAVARRRDGMVVLAV